MRAPAAFFVSCLSVVQVVAAGLGDYVLVRPETLTEADAFVLRDMNGLLARSTGHELKVVTAGEAPAARRIFFGIAPSEGGPTGLVDQDYCTFSRNGDIWLFGGGTNGTRFAAYGFLQDELGYRFFDGRGGVKVPDLSGFVPKPGLRRSRFSFPERMLCADHCRFTGAESYLFLFRNGQNGSLSGPMRTYCGVDVPDDFRVPWPFCHGLAEYLPRNRASANMDWTAKTDGDYEKTHPEYFCLGEDGKRHPEHQPCLSNPEARKIIRRNYFEKLARQKAPASLDLSAGDTPGRFCWCDGCRALERKYGTPGGPLVDLILELAPEAAAKYPDQKLLMLAYRKRQTEIPPKGLGRLPANFTPDFAPIDDDFAQDWLHPNNTNTFANLREWGRLCDRVMMWYYPNPYGAALTPPLGNVGRLATDIRLMKEAGVTTMFFEHNVGVAQMTGLTELQSYVMLQLFRNVKRDWRELVDEFVDFEYGAAAAGVKRYLAKLEELRKSTDLAFPWDASLTYYTYLTPERLSKWGRVFDVLERKVADDRPRLRNLRRLRLGLDYAALQLAKNVSLVGRVRAELAEMLEDAYAPQHRADGEAFVKKIETSLRLFELQFGPDAKPLPQEIFGKFAKEDLFITLAKTHSGSQVEDPDAAYGIATRFDGARDPKAMKLPFVSNLETVLPRSTYTARIGRGVDRENLGPRGQYKFYEMGTATVTKDCFVELGTWWFQAKIGEAYREGAFNRDRIFASLKFEGPAFYPDDTRPNCILCDRVVVIRDRDGANPPRATSN